MPAAKLSRESLRETVLAVTISHCPVLLVTRLIIERDNGLLNGEQEGADMQAATDYWPAPSEGYVVDPRETNARLGYPADARLLIINADDFGMCYAANAATIKAMRDGIVSSTTVMTPCPWAPHALRLLAENPDLPFGIHLTLIAEHTDYRWGPRAPRGMVPSLVDASGFFYGTTSATRSSRRRCWMR